MCAAGGAWHTAVSCMAASPLTGEGTPAAPRRQRERNESVRSSESEIDDGANRGCSRAKRTTASWAAIWRKRAGSAGVTVEPSGAMLHHVCPLSKLARW